MIRRKITADPELPLNQLYPQRSFLNPGPFISGLADEELPVLIWDVEDLQRLPLLSVAEFCQANGLSDHIRDRLVERGFSTSGAVFQAVESGLERAGFNVGHIAELRRALKQFAAGHSVHPNRVVGVIWPGGSTYGLPLLLVPEFCQVTGLSDHIRDLLEDCGFSTSWALFEAVERDLEKAAGFKAGHIMELRRALKQFAARHSVYPNPRAGGIWAEGNTKRLPLLPVAEFCQITSLSNHICVLLEDCGFSTSGALFEAVESDLEKVGFKVGHIIELRRALKQFAARHSVYPNPRAGGIWAGGNTNRLPLLPVAEFCLITGLSNHIRKLLEDCDFSTSGALFEAVESDLEKAGFKVGDITGLRRALQQFVARHSVYVEAIESDSLWPGLQVNDFNGCPAHLPLRHCRTWADLCLFLVTLLEGDKDIHFVSSGNFGLRVPDQDDLLSRETWDLWISRFNEDPEEPPVTLDLYAILRDDTYSCPHCKIENPMMFRLQDKLQQCFLCEFTFLVLYHDEEVSPPLPGTTDEGPSYTPRPRTPDNSETSDGNAAVPSTPRSPVASEGATEPMDFVSLAPEQPINDPLSERAPFLYRPVSPAVQASGVSIPKHVQVIRRRKPFQNDVEDEQTGLIDTADDSITTSAHTPPNYYLEVIHKLYMWVLLGLPNHYSRDAPSILGRINDGVTHPVYTRWVNEWITIGGAAFLLILFISQRSSASYDLLPRAMLFVSVVFLFFSVLYAIILARTFGKLEIDTEGLDWIRQVPQPPKNRFWNPWIMVSMPAVCILWGVTLFILSFIWRTGDTHGRDEASNPSPKQKYEYGPQIAATFAFVLGVIYLRLVVRDVKTMGSDSGAQPTVPGTLLREVSNVVLPDLVGRAEQIVQVFGHIFSINGGVGGPGGHNGGNGGNGGGSQVEIHPGRYSNCTHGAGGPGGSGHIGGRGGNGEEPDVETMPGGYFGNISGGTGGAGGTGNVVGGPGGTGEGTTIQYVSNTSGGSDEMAGSPASTY